MRADPPARAVASLRGLALADAFGSQFFVPANRHALSARELPPGPWQWTDDTEMACSVFRVLADHGTIDQDELAASFAARHDFDRGYGPTTGRMLRLIRQGGDWRTLAAEPYDLVYLDPPYAPPRDDNCYIKRYHFLEGLATYWRGQKIMEGTRTKKLEKRYTPFSYRRTVEDALRRTFAKFRNSAIVLSYSSNAVPDAATIAALLREVKPHVEVRSLEHRYSFGTHANAARRKVSEYVFIAR